VGGVGLVQRVGSDWYSGWKQRWPKKRERTERPEPEVRISMSGQFTGNPVSDGNQR